MAMQSCCFTGFRWNGTPTGREERVANSAVYVAGTNTDRAILIIPDGGGFQGKNVRLLADHFAEEVEATVYVWDVFEGVPFPYKPSAEYPIDKWMKDNPDKFQAWVAANSKPKRSPELFAVARALRAKYAHLSAAGYCYGGWACFALGGEEGLVDAIAVAHPSLLDKEEVDAVKAPVQIHAPQFDPIFTPELKAYCLEKLGKRQDIAWGYSFYPGQAHGFASRGDESVEGERKGMVLVKAEMAAWFRRYMH